MNGYIKEFTKIAVICAVVASGLIIITDSMDDNNPMNNTKIHLTSYAVIKNQ